VVFPGNALTSPTASNRRSETAAAEPPGVQSTPDDATRAASPPGDYGRVYGRRVGRRLRASQRILMDEVLPALALPPLAPNAQLDPEGLFHPPAPAVWLEIGFGAGEHLAYQMQANPGVGFIGCEVYLNGVAALLGQLPPAARARLRIRADDARPLLTALPDASIGRIFVLFPDPWPKTRHRRRRAVSPATLGEFARILKPGGELRLATDHAEYGRSMLAQALAEPRLEWLAERAGDWLVRPADWPATRFELKALAAGRRSLYLRFRRRTD
jgi:tRNA (guanine-N7-)-methyltransferase